MAYWSVSAGWGAGLIKKLRSDYGAGVSPQTAKPRHELVPRECGCQGESKNSSVQNERQRYGRALRKWGSKRIDTPANFLSIRGRGGGHLQAFPQATVQSQPAPPCSL